MDSTNWVVDSRHSTYNTYGIREEFSIVARPPTTSHRTVWKPALSFDLLSLPHRWLANNLVDCYMELCHPQYPFIHETTFREQYDNIWISGQPSDEILSGTINAIFALGCHFLAQTNSAEADAYFQRAKTLILSDLDSKCAGVTNVLQALALLALYPQASPEHEETWNIIGRMIQLCPGLQVSPCSNSDSHEEVVRREMNVRLWWASFVFDAVHSCCYGREPRFSKKQAGVNLPQPLKGEEAQSGDAPNKLSPSSKIFFFVQTIHLCQALRDVALTKTTASSISETFEIDQRIQNWWSQLRASPPTQNDQQFLRQAWRQREVLTAR